MVKLRAVSRLALCLQREVLHLSLIHAAGGWRFIMSFIRGITVYVGEEKMCVWLDHLSQFVLIGLLARSSCEQWGADPPLPALLSM